MAVHLSAMVKGTEAELPGNFSAIRELNENLFATTEEFITKIASASATTGEPYLVRCRGQEETEVSEWFTVLLEQFRTASEQDQDDT